MRVEWWCVLWYLPENAGRIVVETRRITVILLVIFQPYLKYVKKIIHSNGAFFYPMFANCVHVFIDVRSHLEKIFESPLNVRLGSTTIRTNVKFGPNAGFGPKTNSDQKFKFGPKYSGY